MSDPGPTVRRMTIMAIAAATAALAVGSLWLVSIAGWVRTGGLRRGMCGSGLIREHHPLLARVSTSHATFLPGMAGGLIVMIAGLQTAAYTSVPSIALGVVGAGITWMGFAARVASLEFGPSGMAVRYAARSPFTLAWDDVTTLAPPRWPLGGWRLVGSKGSRVLMGSDLFGHEGLLATVIDAAGLRFENGAWRRSVR